MQRTLGKQLLSIYPVQTMQVCWCHYINMQYVCIFMQCIKMHYNLHHHITKSLFCIVLNKEGFWHYTPPCFPLLNVCYTPGQGIGFWAPGTALAATPPLLSQASGGGVLVVRHQLCTVCSAWYALIGLNTSRALFEHHKHKALSLFFLLCWCYTLFLLNLNSDIPTCLLITFIICGLPWALPVPRLCLLSATCTYLCLSLDYDYCLPLTWPQTVPGLHLLSAACSDICLSLD